MSLPVNLALIDYKNELTCLFEEILNATSESTWSYIIFGGDFNFAADDSNVGYRTFVKCFEQLQLHFCDSLMCNDHMVTTYHHPLMKVGSFIDHFVVDERLWTLINKAEVLESGANLSDHCAISMCVMLPTTEYTGVSYAAVFPSIGRLRRDKGDLDAYYAETYNRLKRISPPYDLLHCHLGCNCSAQRYVDLLYEQITDAIRTSALGAIPRCKPGFFKPWCNETLTELKAALIDAHKVWKEAGRPSSGGIHVNETA